MPSCCRASCSGWITATGIGAHALFGKGDWATYDASQFTGAFAGSVLANSPSGGAAPTAAEIVETMDADSTQLQRIAGKTDQIQSGLITIASQLIGASPVQIFTGGTVTIPLAHASGDTWPDLVATGAAVELLFLPLLGGLPSESPALTVTGTVLCRGRSRLRSRPHRRPSYSRA